MPISLVEDVLLPDLQQIKRISFICTKRIIKFFNHFICNKPIKTNFNVGRKSSTALSQFS